MKLNHCSYIGLLKVKHILTLFEQFLPSSKTGMELSDDTMLQLYAFAYTCHETARVSGCK